MRLIDADEFELSMQHEWEKNNLSNGTWRDIREWLNDAPTIEAKPVKHGEWLFDKVVWHCSLCGTNPTRGMGYTQGEHNLYRYCPNCGAKMNVEE